MSLHHCILEQDNISYALSQKIREFLNTKEDFYLATNSPAIIHCFEIEDKLFVSNNEYISQVNYCPYCGFQAKERVK